MRVTRQTLSLAAGIAATLALAGCSSAPGEAKAIAAQEQVDVGSRDGRGAWIYWPETIRVHRLSSVMKPADGGAPTIDLRVEAVDRLGEVTRAVGTFVVVVSASGCQPEEQRWKIVVDSLEAHRARYDPVTDTYRFQIAPAWTQAPASQSKVAVKVLLYSADGEVLAAVAELAWP